MASLRELKRQLGEGEPQKCYVLAGEDAFLANAAYLAIKQAMKLEYEELNLSIFTEESVVTSDLVAACQSLPFLSPRRLVLAKEYYPAAGEAALLEKGFLLLENDTAVLVIVNSKKSDCFKKLGKYVYSVDCAHPEPEDAARWIMLRAQNAGQRISAANAALVAEYCLCDMSRISVECEKLVCYTAGKAEIARADVDAVVAKESEYEVYELSGAIAAKDKTRALTILDSLLSRGTNEQLLLMALYAHYRRMLFAAIGKDSIAELAKLLNVKEYAVKKAAQQAKLFKPKELKSALDLIADTDYRNKSGRMNSGTALQYVVLKLVNP